MISAENVRILIVDNKPELRDIVKAKFAAFGFQVETAENEQQANDLLGEKSFQVVITDVDLPSMDGIMLLRSIRQRHYNEPKVFFSSGFTQSSREELFALGADGFFDKPFEAASLRESLKKVLLTPAQRWQERAYPGEHSCITATSKFTHQSNNQSDKRSNNQSSDQPNSLISLGRGGVFLQYDGPLSDTVIEEPIPFVLNLPQHSVQLSGWGYCQWIRKKAIGDLPVGIGVEIESLKSQDLKTVLELITQFQPTAYIPLR